MVVLWKYFSRQYSNLIYPFIILGDPTVNLHNIFANNF